MERITRLLGLVLLLVVLALPTAAQEQTLGLTTYDAERAFEGYTLFTARFTGTSFLIDMDGNVVNHWRTEAARARDAFLLDNGNILRSLPDTDLDTRFDESMTGYGDGRLVEVTWDDEIVWDWTLEGHPEWYIHHGVEVMPNGNLLLIVWDYRTIDEAVEMGLNAVLNEDLTLNNEDHSFWPDSIIEVSRETGEIVWVWNAWDHLVQNFDQTRPNYGNPSENLGRVDINYNRPEPQSTDVRNAGDWMHSNAIDYNPELDQIMLSVRDLHEIWFIDRSISTEEAAGPAGDILYRWGNPEAYLGIDESRQLYAQHDAQWVPEGLPGEGNIIIFNNRVPIPGMDEVAIDGEPIQVEHSSVVEITPPLNEDGTYVGGIGQAYGPEEPTWTYVSDPLETFYGRIVSGVERLPNGNTLITEGTTGTIFEVTPEGDVVWQFTNPVARDGLLEQGIDLEGIPFEVLPWVGSNGIFRARRYAADHPALVGRDLTPMGTFDEVVPMLFASR